MNMLVFNIGDTIKEGFAGIMLALDGIVYSLVSTMYKVYTVLASARILSNDAFTTIANKLYVIIGVAMLFVLAYSILRAIIDPDQMGKGDMSGSKIIRGVITCVAGLALTPVLFNVAYQGQDIILRDNIIGKMFFNSENNKITYDDIQVDGETIAEGQEINADDAMYDDAGNVVAIYVWQSFFYPSELEEISEDDIVGKTADYLISPAASTAAGIGCAIGVGAAILASVFNLAFGALAASATIASCSTAFVGTASSAVAATMAEEMTLAEAISYASSSGDFGIFTIFANNFIEGEIHYNWGISSIVGLFVAYAFLSFSIDMAVRAAKLAYYQIIAPIPLILQVLPKFKGNFDKWVKNIIGTFLEVFIRLSIVYVVVYIIAHLNSLVSSDAALWNNQDIGIGIAFMARTILIVGLIIFAKQAPKLITDTFGIPAGDMKLGLGKKLAEGGLFTAGATLGAATTGLVNNFGGELAKGYQASKGKPLTGKVRALGGGLIKGAASGVAGGLSAGTRTGYRGVRDHMNGKPMQARDMKDAASKGASESAQKKFDRERFKAENKDAPGGVLGAHARNVASSIVGWAAGPVDTSYMDGQTKLYSDLAGLKSSLEGLGLVTNDDAVKAAQRHKDDLARRDVIDVAYDEKVNAKKAAERSSFEAARQAILTKSATETDAAYNARFESYVNSHSTDARVSSFLSQYGNAKKADSNEFEAHLNNMVKATVGGRNDFTLDPTSAEYRAAVDSLNKARNDADNALKKAKKDAVARQLLEASVTGKGNDVSRTLKDFFNNHQGELRTYSNVKFNGNQTLEQYVEANFGHDVLKGKVDLGLTVGKSGDYTFESKNSAGNVINVTVKTDSGRPEYVVNDPSLSAPLTLSENEFKNKYTINGSIDFKNIQSSGSAESTAVTLKSAAEVAKDNLVNSDEYINAQSRKRKQQEGKK